MDCFEQDYLEIARLIELYNRGDEAAGDELIMKIDPKLKQCLYRYKLHKDEDSFQFARLKAVELIKKYDASKCNGKFLGYLDRMITANLWDSVRKEEKYKTNFKLMGEEYFSDSWKSLSFMEEGYSNVEIMDAINKLPDLQRDIVLKHIFSGHSMSKIARELEFSHYQIANHYNLALNTLKKEIFGDDIHKD